MHRIEPSTPSALLAGTRASSLSQAAPVPLSHPPPGPATATRSSELHLLAESGAERGTGLHVLVPPAGVSFLVAGRAPLALKQRRPRRACLTLEPVARDRASGRQARLLVLLPPGLRARWLKPIVCCHSTPWRFWPNWKPPAAVGWVHACRSVTGRHFHSACDSVSAM